MEKEKRVRKQKQVQNGYKRKKVTDTVAPVLPLDTEQVVSSKIEHTNPEPLQMSKSDKISVSQLAYRKSIKEIGLEISEYAIVEAQQNLLNAKLALWDAISLIEKKMKERTN